MLEETRRGKNEDAEKGISCRPGRYLVLRQLSTGTGGNSRTRLNCDDKRQKQMKKQNARNTKNKSSAQQNARGQKARAKEKYSEHKHKFWSSPPASVNFREQSPHPPELELPKNWDLGAGRGRDEPAIGYKLQGERRGCEARGSASCAPTRGNIPDSGYQLPGTTSRRRAMRQGAGVLMLGLLGAC
ncbi:hypothetical protein TARUN_2328 [Trichoderma arundinaceum]|uniref:Uncharacterized protein n=1 Tax=Trichoderma arundinaceum TaxID=490622 RepID=A0A395NV79_TRIAR|nr:hypothetical protein TARUN_2328 [Trichoderma arundinaceum]